MPVKMLNYELERPSDLGKLVTVGGPGATGSSTIAKILAKKWGLHRIYAGEIMRNNADAGRKAEANSDINTKTNTSSDTNANVNPNSELNDNKNASRDNNPDSSDNQSERLQSYLDEQVSTHPEIDKKIDRLLVRMSYYPDMLVEGKFFAAIASSVGIPCTIKIWVTANLHTRIMHVLEREGFLKEGNKMSRDNPKYKQIRTELMRRQSNDMRRCQKIYHQDLSKPEYFNDIIIDTTGLTVSHTIKKLLKKIEKDEKLSKRFSPKELKF
jgi:cytidylate kinase